MKETLGQQLKMRREAHLISMQEISHSTGISVPMISALEEDNFHLIPQPEMTVKYLKKYAAYVGLDKKEILSRYKTQCELHHQKEYLFPHLSTFSEGDKSSKHVRGVKSLSRKQVIEGVFWMGIVIWALIIIYLYFHVLSLRKMGTHEIQEIIPSKEVSQEDSHQRNNPMPSVASERIGSSLQSSSQESSRSIVPVLFIFNSETEAIKAGYRKVREYIT